MVQQLLGKRATGQAALLLSAKHQLHHIQQLQLNRHPWLQQAAAAAAAAAHQPAGNLPRWLLPGQQGQRQGHGKQAHRQGPGQPRLHQAQAALAAAAAAVKDKQQQQQPQGTTKKILASQQQQQQADKA